VQAEWNFGPSGDQEDLSTPTTKISSALVISEKTR
jgi:hypothetical protein